MPETIVVEFRGAMAEAEEQINAIERKMRELRQMEDRAERQRRRRQDAATVPGAEVGGGGGGGGGLIKSGVMGGARLAGVGGFFRAADRFGMRNAAGKLLKGAGPAGLAMAAFAARDEIGTFTRLATGATLDFLKKELPANVKAQLKGLGIDVDKLPKAIDEILADIGAKLDGLANAKKVGEAVVGQTFGVVKAAARIGTAGNLSGGTIANLAGAFYKTGFLKEQHRSEMESELRIQMARSLTDAATTGIANLVTKRW